MTVCLAIGLALVAGLVGGVAVAEIFRRLPAARGVKVPAVHMPRKEEYAGSES